MNKDWLIELSNGHFEAIPDNLTWANGGSELAGLVDGYELARSSSLSKSDLLKDAGLIKISVRNFTAVRTKIIKGDFDINPIDLWCALFFECRRKRFIFNIDSEKSVQARNLKFLNTASNLLKNSLLSASEDEIAIIQQALSLKKKRPD